MIFHKGILLLVIGAVSLANAFNTLVPWDKDLVYHYQALVKAGTQNPESFASQFLLDGHLHIQANNNATHVKLTDLKYKIYNGVLNHVDEHLHSGEEVPLPAEVHDLQTAFKIVYDHQGKAIGIATEEHEKEYTRNIKKAIAAILQMDVGQVVKPQKHPHAFITEEHTIHGPSMINYNVLPHGEWIEVHKLQDEPHMHQHLHHHSISNTNPLPCDVHQEQPISFDSQRKYHIVQHNGHHLVQHIEAYGGIFYHPFHGQSQTQYLFVNQTFDLLHQEPIKEQLHVSAEHFDHDLTYHYHDSDLEVESVHDITNGRRHIDLLKLVPIVHQMLEDVWAYLHADHIHAGTPNYEHGQLINRLYKVLAHLDQTHLLQIHSELKQSHAEHHAEIEQVFLHMLPLLGTKASTHVIKHLVAHSLIAPGIAGQLLHDMPRHVKVPSRALVTDMEEVLHWGDKIPWNVRKAALIAFGSLVHYAHEHEVHHQNVHHVEHSTDLHHEHHHEHEEHHSEHEEIDSYYEKYVTIYVNKLKQTNDYHQQFIYMSGLFNMKLRSVFTHMLPAIKGEWWQDHHHRLTAMWTVSPYVLQDPDAVFTTYWPIFANPQEHTELRTVAYWFIAESAHLSVSRLNNIFWYLQHEHNHEVYSFVYSHLHALAHTTEICKVHFKHHAMELLKYLHPPTHGLSVYYLAEFVDPKYGFGLGYQGSVINTNTSVILTGLVTSHLIEYKEDVMVYVKIHGVDKLHNIFQLNTDHNTAGIFNYEQIAKLFMVSENNQNIHLDISVLKDSDIINSWHIDSTNLHELHNLVNWFDHKQRVESNLIHIFYDRFTEVFIPTDLGFPAIWSVLAPSVHKHVINLSHEVVNNVLSVHVDINHVHWKHSQHGLQFYNPIVDVYQGIHTYHSVDSITPIYMDWNLNSAQKSIKLSWKHHQNPHKDIWGLRSHVATFVFVKDDLHHEVLKHTHHYVLVAHGEQSQKNEVQPHHSFRHNYTILDEDDFNTGRHFHVEVFDTDHHISNGTWNHALSVFAQHHNKNFETPWGHHLLTILHWQQYVVLQPLPGVHGLLIRSVPSQEHHVSNVDLNIRWNTEWQHGDSLYRPGVKFNTRATYSIKNQEKSLKTWDLNTIIDINPGHTINNLKLQLTRIIPGQKDFKVCVEGVKKYTHDTVTGHLNIGMGQTADGKCIKDDAIIDITMHGEKSEGQLEHHPYGACQYPVPYALGHYLHTFNCLKAHTSVRHYTYDIKTLHVPTEFQKHFNHIWDLLKSYHFTHYQFHDEHPHDIAEHHTKIDVLYPMNGHEVDVHVFTPQHWYSLTGVPTNYWQWFGVHPDSLVYSEFYEHLHSMDLVDHCSIHSDGLRFNSHHVYQHVTNDWGLYVGDVQQSPKYAVYVKLVNQHDLAVKIVDHSHVLEIHPQHEQHHQHKILVDGQQVTGNKHHLNEDWVSYHVFSEEGLMPVAAMMHHSGLHVVYDQHHVHVVLPKVDHHWHGHCHMH